MNDEWGMRNDERLGSAVRAPPLVIHHSSLIIHHFP
jgi:hypothetical protein